MNISLREFNMGLTETTINIMKACKPILIANRKVLGCRFYELLFTEHPDVQNMFNVSHLGGIAGVKPKQVI